MSLNVGVLSATLSLDDDPFVKGLKRMDNRVAEAGAKWAHVGDRMSLGLTAPIVAGFGLATKAASNLAESASQTDQIFGTATSRIGNFAKSAADKFGQSERAARDAANTFGLFFTNAGKTGDEAADMSIKLTGLASDMASFKNTSPEQAVQALGAALRGESEPIRAYGVMLDDATLKQRALDMGLIDSATGVLPPAIRMQAAYAEILAQTTTIQGDFERTSGGLANQQRILSAEIENTAAGIGEQLLPFALKGAEGIGFMVDVFDKLPGPLRTALVGFAALLAATGPILSVGGRLAKNWDSIASGASKLSGGLGRFKGALAGLGMVAATAAAISYGQALSDAAPKMDRVMDSTKNFTEAMDDNALAALALAAENGKLDDVVRDVASTNVEAAERMLRQAEAAGITGDKIDELRGIIEDKRGADKQGARDQANYTKEIDGAAGATENLTDKLKEQTEAFGELLDATLAQFDSNLGYRKSIDATEESLSALATTQKEHGADSEEYRDALMDAEGAILSQAAAALKLADDQATANGKTLTAAEKATIYRSELSKLADGLAPDSPLRAQLAGYIGDLDAIPSEVKTKLLADASGAFATVRQFLGYLDTVGVSSPQGHTVLLGFKQQQLKTRASGGPVWSGEDFLVGEEGPEIVRFSGAGHVFDADTTRQMLSGGGSTAPASAAVAGSQTFVDQSRVTNHITTGLDPAETVAAIDRWTRQMHGTGFVEIIRRAISQ